MTVIASDSISHAMEYGPKLMLTWGSASTCVGEIPKFQSPYLPVWNVLLVISVNMEYPVCQIWFDSANLLLWFLDFLASWGWPKLFTRPSNLSIQYPLTLFICLTLWCEHLPASVSPLSWSDVLMDGEELDDKRYIWCQDCRSPPFRSVNRIATKAHG